MFSGCLELGGATGTPLVAQTVEHLPIMRDTQFQSLGQEDLLEKAMATHSSILATHHQKVAQRNIWASLVAQLVKNPPIMQETWVRFLG